ncbi:MAG: flagellar hook-basal body complex protein, partial [Limnochordia bacterium]|nr:flagellar hook-basal body complex protein [Limnochordia bacterium]
DNAYSFAFESALKDGAPANVFSDGGSLYVTSAKPLTLDIPNGDRLIQFNSDGSFLKLSGENEENTLKFQPADAEALEVTLSFGDFTQYADTFTGKFMSQNGYYSGALESYAIDQNGVIVGSFSNGLTRALGQVALARFANAAGLQRSGSTMFVDTPNSGEAQIGAAGIPGFGQISPSSLEMSNVDLSEEFTEMIITQRGFQANSRIITTSDEMLQELVNLKR